MTRFGLGELPSNAKVLELLQQESEEQARIEFARRARILFARVEITGKGSFYAKLTKAVEAGRLTKGVLKSASYWQCLFEDGHERTARPDFALRLVDALNALVPSYSLAYLLDDHTFTHADAVGPEYPLGFRVTATHAFERWLSESRCPDGTNVEGEYDLRFPWMDDCKWLGAIAQAKARIYRVQQHHYFESVFNPHGTPLLFTGAIRFTGKRSAVIVGFSSTPAPSQSRPRAVVRDAHEMITQPYRLPEQPSGWWRGTTMFIDPDSFEYGGTVGIVMRRVSEHPPTLEAWKSICERKMEIVTGGHEHKLASQEIMRCPLVRSRASDRPGDI